VVRQVCPACALPSLNGVICGQCQRQAPAYHATYAVLEYVFPVDRLVQALKYQRRLAVSSYFSALLLPLGEHLAIDMIVPMPLHVDRLRWRGFNQAVEIARPLSRQWGVPLYLNAASRKLDGPAQVSLPWSERHANVKNAFVCEMDLTDRHVLVVDDVMTTGASLHALARTLKNAGASRVENLVVARTPPPF